MSLDDFLQIKYEFAAKKITLKQLHECYEPADQEHAKMLLEKTQQGQSFDSWLHPHHVNNEKTLWIESTWKAERNNRGEVIGLVGMDKDLTKQVLAEQNNQALTNKLLKEREYLNATQKIAHVGSFRTNLQNNKAWFSDNFKAIFGYPKEQEFRLEQWLLHIHPDDMPEVKALTQRIFENHDYVKTTLNYRIFDKRNRLKYHQVIWDYKYDEAGNPTLYGRFDSR